MATKEVLQAGRRVIVDSKGNKTYAPFRGSDSSDSEGATPSTLGTGAAAAAAQAVLDARKRREEDAGMKCGGKVKKYAKGGSVDGVAQRGKTRGKHI